MKRFSFLPHMVYTEFIMYSVSMLKCGLIGLRTSGHVCLA